VSVAALDRTFTRTDKFPGWWVVGACFVLMTMQAGVGFYGLAVFLNAFSNELGWTVASISLATTVFFFVGGIAGLGVAKLIARHDVRIIILFGAALNAVCVLLLGYVSDRWQLYLIYALYAVGWVAVGQGPATTVVTRWFHAKRTSALAVASTGMSVGGIVVTPVVKWLVDGMGIGGATPWLAVIWLVSVVPVTVLFVRPDPQRYGWMPDGERSTSTESPVVSGIGLAEATQTKFFRALSVGYFFAFFSQVGGIQQLVKMVEERTTAGTATAALMVLSVMSIIGRFGAQAIITRFNTMRFTVVLASMQGFSFVILAFSEGTVGLMVGAAVFGITIGNLLMMQSLLVADRFGVFDFPRISARIALVATVGMAVGPFALGWLRDNAGGYATSYVVAALCSSIAVGVFSWATTDSESFHD
jgi:MFS family permease